MNKEVIPVFLTIDDNFAKFASVVIASLIKQSAGCHYQVILVHQGLSEAVMARLKQMQTEEVAVDFFYLDRSLSEIDSREENRLRVDFFTLTIFYRLFLADCFPQFDKGIYIDSDTVITGDLSQLFAIDLGDCLIGAAHDYSIEHVSPLIEYIEQALDLPFASYINSGVLLMNMKALRDEHFSEHFLHLLQTYHFDSIAPDQDYLNMICRDRILYLDEKWDAMPKELPTYAHEAVAEPQLVHYNLYYKPWHFSGVMYEDYFWDAAQNSPFYDEIVQEADEYTDEQRATDVDRLNDLINKAGRLAGVGTFNQVERELIQL